MSNNIYINVIDNNYWYHPSIFTSSKRKWQSRPYKSLKKLLVNENLINSEATISFNKDKELKLFSMLQQLKEFPLSLKKSEIDKVSKGINIIKKLPKSKITLIIDKTSISQLFAGHIPFFSLNYLKKEFKGEPFLLWRKNGWIELTEKKIIKYTKLAQEV